jgi:hypothetical protein
VSKKPAREDKEDYDNDTKQSDHNDDRPFVCSPERQNNRDANNGRFSPDQKSRYAESKDEVPSGGQRRTSSPYIDLEDEAESSTMGNASNSFYLSGSNPNSISKQGINAHSHESEQRANEQQLRSSPVKSSKKFDRIPRSDTMMYSKEDINKINKDVSKLNSHSRHDRADSIDETEDDSDHIETLDADADDMPQRRRSNKPNRLPRDQSHASSASDDDHDKDAKVSSRRSSQTFQQMELDHQSEERSCMAAKKGGSLPPPSAAPPRRAKDLVDDLGESNRSRRSVEDLIASRRSSRIEQELSDDDEADSKVSTSS